MNKAKPGTVAKSNGEKSVVASKPAGVKPVATSKPSGAKSVTTNTSTSTQKSGSIPKQGIERQRLNIQKVQNVLLIWLSNSDDCKTTITQLQQSVSDIHTFVNGGQCIEFIRTISDNKVCMVISGLFAQDMVPRVHNMSQVDSIFLYCENKNFDDQWTKDWSKIKGVFNNIVPICEALKEIAQQCKQNDMAISFMASNKKLDQLDPSFMYTQILKEILLTIKFEEKHIREFIDYCRDVFATNREELVHVKQLENNYHSRTPIWWYTCESFLYPMLNRALRLMNGDIIIRLGFFIGDLHRHIEQLYKKQYTRQSSSGTFTVYRGQGLSKVDFERMTKTQGGLLSFNNFLSTSKNQKISYGFAREAATHPDLVGILFIMKIDPSQSTTPFASVQDVSCFQTEDEVLFSMHTIFRIYDIKPVNLNNRLYEVNLTLTSDNDKDLCELTNHIRKESFPHAGGWHRLGLVLLKMGQFDKAEEVFEGLIRHTTNESERGSIYQELGIIKFDQGDYRAAIMFYEKALEINQKTLSSNHPNLANSYNCIGNAYQSMGDYPKACLFYEKTLHIQQQSLLPEHPDLAPFHNNIGVVCQRMGDYPKALSSYEEALRIRQKSLLPNHPDLAYSYGNIGNVYAAMANYPKALSYYEKTLSIQQQSLPDNHPDLASSYCNIGFVYKNLNDHPKALSCYEKDLQISRQVLPSNHPYLATSYMNIGTVYGQMGENSKALSYFEKALEIQQQSLPTDHPDLASSYSNIGFVYQIMGDHSKALLHHERAVQIAEKSLPSNHPKLQKCRKNLEDIKKKL